MLEKFVFSILLLSKSGVILLDKQNPYCIVFTVVVYNIQSKIKHFH